MAQLQLVTLSWCLFIYFSSSSQYWRLQHCHQFSQQIIKLTGHNNVQYFVNFVLRMLTTSFAVQEGGENLLVIPSVYECFTDVIVWYVHITTQIYNGIRINPYS